MDIVATTADLPEGPDSVRTDCAAAASCTYAEEIQNFANWWTYYRTRMALMKTATGRAFLPIDDRFRIGFITINPNSPVTADKFIGAAKYDATQKEAWYDLLYQQDTNGSTPNRTALHRVGRYYAGTTDGINDGMTPDPVEYSCQQNFALLTTDGYWNDSLLLRRQPGQRQQRLHHAGLRAPTTAASAARRTRSPTWRPTTTRRTFARPARCRQQRAHVRRATRTRRSTW